MKKQTCPPKYSRYIYPGSPGREIIYLMEFRGSLSYNFSALRKQKRLNNFWKNRDDNQHPKRRAPTPWPR